MGEKTLPPVHPAEILLEDLMKPLGLSQNALGRALGVPPRRINEIVHGKRGITGDTALRLARYFGTSAEMWMGLQADFELEIARDEKLAEIERTVPVRADTEQVGEVKPRRVVKAKTRTPTSRRKTGDAAA